MFEDTIWISFLRNEYQVSVISVIVSTLIFSTIFTQRNKDGKTVLTITTHYLILFKNAGNVMDDATVQETNEKCVSVINVINVISMT